MKIVVMERMAMLKPGITTIELKSNSTTGSSKELFVLPLI
jgi:hypothetical protein